MTIQLRPFSSVEERHSYKVHVGGSIPSGGTTARGHVKGWLLPFHRVSGLDRLMLGSFGVPLRWQVEGPGSHPYLNWSMLPVAGGGLALRIAGALRTSGRRNLLIATGSISRRCSTSG